MPLDRNGEVRKDKKKAVSLDYESAVVSLARCLKVKPQRCMLEVLSLANPYNQ